MTDHNNKKYVRKLSAIERYNLVINEVYRYNLEAFFEGSGELVPSEWERAVAIAAEANPGARVRLKSFLGFAKWVDSGIAPEVRVVNAPHWSGYDEEGTDFLREPFYPLKGGAICEVLLLPGEPARVVFRAVHGAMDARGMDHFCRDVVRALRGEPPVGSRSTLTDLDVRLMFQDKVEIEEKKLTNCIPALPVGDYQNKPLRYIWRRVRLNKNVSGILPKMAVFLAAEARRHAEGDVIFTIPVDFRSLRHDVDSTANLTGYLQVEVGAEDKPRDVMKRLNAAIRNHEDCYNPSVLKIVSWTPIWHMVRDLRKKAPESLHTIGELPTGGLVSLGQFKGEDYAVPNFEVKSVVGIPGPVGRLNVLMMNYRDGTELVFTMPAAYNDRGQLETLLNNLHEFLGC